MHPYVSNLYLEFLCKLTNACGRYNRDIFGLRNSTQRACQTPWKFHARSMEIPWNVQSNGHSSRRPGGLSGGCVTLILLGILVAFVCVGLCLSAFAEIPAVVTASPDSNEVVQTNTLTRVATSSAMPTKTAVIGPLRCLASEPK